MFPPFKCARETKLSPPRWQWRRRHLKPIGCWMDLSRIAQRANIKRTIQLTDAFVSTTFSVWVTVVRYQILYLEFSKFTNRTQLWGESRMVQNVRTQKKQPYELNQTVSVCHESLFLVLEEGLIDGGHWTCCGNSSTMGWRSLPSIVKGQGKGKCMMRENDKFPCLQAAGKHARNLAFMSEFNPIFLNLETEPLQDVETIGKLFHSFNFHWCKRWDGHSVGNGWCAMATCWDACQVITWQTYLDFEMRFIEIPNENACSSFAHSTFISGILSSSENISMTPLFLAEKTEPQAWRFLRSTCDGLWHQVQWSAMKSQRSSGIFYRSARLKLAAMTLQLFQFSLPWRAKRKENVEKHWETRRGSGKHQEQKAQNSKVSKVVKTS